MSKKTQKVGRPPPSETENILTLLLLLAVAGCCCWCQSCKSEEMQEEESVGVAQTLSAALPENIPTCLHPKKCFQTKRKSFALEDLQKENKYLQGPQKLNETGWLAHIKIFTISHKWQHVSKVLLVFPKVNLTGGKRGDI